MQKLISLEKLIGKGLEELGLVYSREQVMALLTYLAELKKWNKAYNLTSLKTDEDIIIKHFIDSLLYLKAMPDDVQSMMDVGSGAGFPGLPIKIMRPDITVYLVEPSGKKAIFLKHMIGLLKLEDAAVVEKRVEDLESMDVDAAVTRALFDVGDFCKKVSPVLESGGVVILSKGPKAREELKGMEQGLNYKVMALSLPLTDIKRFMIVIRKKGSVKNEDVMPAVYTSPRTDIICINAECRLRKAGCRGYEGCPGFKARTVNP